MKITLLGSANIRVETGDGSPLIEADTLLDATGTVRVPIIGSRHVKFVVVTALRRRATVFEVE